MLRDRIVASIADKYFNAHRTRKNNAVKAALEKAALEAAFDAGVKLGAAAADGKEILVKR